MHGDLMVHTIRLASADGTEIGAYAGAEPDDAAAPAAVAADLIE